ncbi:methylated-DNA--[protein]-cysteine S-methyltransferase [Niabella beijingensis]|uniref:methylated-DNA--[protein]-cysteine S-methyltransferase n=1 Tax=Niabella beijingensis TaxID=2872700 RepID=UPI001CBD6B3D|nr:methylated-DNA--[protein]-cysteine S-methyltransferase [Niabella beijingensis]MBZ4187531.1 methylated-DNA--[protein]-cysteine S-methyltransferase [Niabella beijingensis]
MEQYFYKEVASPTGPLRLIATAAHLVGVQWRTGEKYVSGEQFVKEELHPLLLETERQLDDYFSGKRKLFELPVMLTGSDFQKKVWELLADIPFGKTISYGEMARRIGDIKTVRAVGGALNKNPVPIIIPCHRVIGADGKMIGFGGGVQRKTYLLNLENPKPQLDLWT